MDDETFLKEMTYDVNLNIVDNTNNTDEQNTINNISSYNIGNNNVSELYNKNWNNLFTDKISIIEDKVNYVDKKLVYNFTFDISIHLGGEGYCFLGFDVVHQQSKNLNKPDAINRLLITPKIYYDQIGKGDIANYNFTIPSQEIKLFFYNNFFNFDNQNNVSVDSYISDKQSFNLYENNIDSGNNSVPDRHLLLDTSEGISYIEISSEKSLGKQIPKLAIDTSNFYLDGDENHKDTLYQVNLSGLMLSDVKYKILNDPSWESVVIDSNKYNMNLEFDIRDSDFENQSKNYEKQYTFHIAGKEMFKYFSNTTTTTMDSKIDLELRVKAKFDNNGNRIPFHYYISSIRINGNYSQFQYNNKLYRMDVELKLNSSSNVIVKTKPKDFSYTRAKQAINTIQKDELVFSSSYSSNIFDDTFITNDLNNRIKSNYEIVLEEARKRFKEVLETNQDFINFGIDVNNPFSMFKNPFIQTQYLDSQVYYRSKGKMSLKYSPVNKVKYFNSFEVVFRAMISKSQNQNEIIEVNLNNDLLNEKSKLYKNIDNFLVYLNNLSTSNKLQYIKVINKDTNDKLIDIVSDINFSKSQYNGIISVDIRLNPRFRMLDNVNNKLVRTKSINSSKLSIDNYTEKVSLSINESRVRELASTVSNYDEFISKYSSEINSLINISYNGLEEFNQIVKSTKFVKDPNFNYKIFIEVTLNDGFVFYNSQNVDVVSVANINWKDQNIQATPIRVNMDYSRTANYLSNFNSLDDFENQVTSNNPNNFANLFTFNESSNISDIYSIDFVKSNNSPNKVIVRLKAKEWKYFDYEGSTSKDDTIDFIVSNIIWKNDNSSIAVQGVCVNVDMAYLYKLLVREYNSDNNLTFQKFIDNNLNNFINFGSNKNSIIKLNPYELLSLNPPFVSANENGIFVKLELNYGYYVNRGNSYSQDRNVCEFQTFISKQEIIDFHEDYISPKPENQLQVQFNYNKISNDTRRFDNIDKFINDINNDYALSKYFVFNNSNDILKIDRFKIVKTSKNSLDVSIELFDQYYFSDESLEVKSKTFSVSNLLFKGEENNFIEVVVDVNRQAILEESKKFYSLDDMLKFYENKLGYEDYKHLLIIDESQSDSIKEIKMLGGSSLNSIQISIKLNNGYYFQNYPISQSEMKIEISNLLFKDDPSYEDVLTKTNLSINGNWIFNKASDFRNFSELKTYLESQENWSLFVNGNINDLLRLSVYKKSNNKILIKTKLKDGFYFAGEHYSVNEKEFTIGNLFYKGNNSIELKDIDIKFNEKRFYEFCSNQEFNSWADFINYISPRIMNFVDRNNAVLWSNADSINVFNNLQVGLKNNKLNVSLELNDGYYFDSNDMSNSAIELSYSKDELKQLYQNGYNKIKDEESQTTLIIALCVSIPFVIVFIIIGLYIWKIKRDKRKEEM